MALQIFRRTVLPALALLASTSVLRAAVPNRVGAITQGERSPLAHMVPGQARRSADLGAAPLDRVLASVTLNFNVSSAQQAALNQLIIDQQDPSSPRYHQWLTPAQYGARFGLSASDLARVSAWLTGQGLTITAVAPSSNFITVSGTIAQIQAAFGTSIHSLSIDGEQHISNLTDPVLPSALSGVVNSIFGLNDFKLKPRARLEKVVRPNFTSSLGSHHHYLAPGDYYTIYDINPLLASSINGSGVTIAVVGQTDISLSDVTAFRSASGLTANLPTVRLIGADPGILNNDLPEAMLDVEWSGAVAPSASILYVNSNDVIGISLLTAITSNLAPIISISYGTCESNWGQVNLVTLNQYFQQANLQGQTIVGPGGDSGATDCDYQSTSAADGLAVDFPASSPFVTGTGGTMFNDGGGSFWSASNGSNSGSATGYIPEGVWNESSVGGIAAGGGGASAYFSKPAWQVGAGVPSDLSRDVPDISLASASGHDGFLFCVSGRCVNGYRASDQTLSVVGGTSAAAPAFAGILALIEQKTGGRLGNANPQLYGLANSTFYNNVFHDVTGGNNSASCIQGSPNCPSGGSIGYTAGPGYDLATGLGSLDVYNLVSKWGLVPSSGQGSTTGAAITSTVVTTSAPTCGISSGSLALSVAVKNSVPTSTVVPTGSVQFLMDNAPIGSPVALGNGAVTYTLNTSALVSGGHTVSAVYLGDSNFAGSKGSLLTDVVSTTQSDFSITPCTSSASAVVNGNAGPITFTVNPFNGFTGPVTLKAIADATLAASYTFSVSPVVISGSTSGSSVFTLSAYENNTGTTTGLIKIASDTSGPSGPSSPSGPGASRSPDTSRSAYMAGSGAALASLFLLTLPRRRRWGALLGVVLSIGALGASGCGGGTTAIPSGPVTTPPTSTTTPAAAGTYTVTVVGAGSTPNGNRVHSVQVTFTVR